MASGAEGGLATDREDAKLHESDKEPQEAISSLQESYSSKGQGEEGIAKVGNTMEEVSPLIQQQSVPIKEQTAERVQPEEGMGEGKSFGVQEGRLGR